jgi:hypothetical protein
LIFLKEKAMKRSVALNVLFILLLIGCANSSDSPRQVKSRMEFGSYSLMPPRGYWYFPRQYPYKELDEDNSFLLTFWDTKSAAVEAGTKRSPGKFWNPVVNIGVFKNEYKDKHQYYKALKLKGLDYEPLPEEAKILRRVRGWSCKVSLWGFYSLECMTMPDNIVLIAVFGPDKDEVLAKVSLLKSVLESFSVMKR